MWHDQLNWKVTKKSSSWEEKISKFNSLCHFLIKKFFQNQFLNVSEVVPIISISLVSIIKINRQSINQSIDQSLTKVYQLGCLFRRSCLVDMCDCPRRRHCLCSSLLAFLRDCERAGGNGDNIRQSHCRVFNWLYVGRVTFLCKVLLSSQKNTSEPKSKMKSV